jgi:hypothetical protein
MLKLLTILGYKFGYCILIFENYNFLGAYNVPITNYLNVNYLHPNNTENLSTFQLYQSIEIFLLGVLTLGIFKTAQPNFFKNSMTPAYILQRKFGENALKVFKKSSLT